MMMRWVTERISFPGSLATSQWKLVVFVSFAAWIIVVGMHHEPWFDESQAWLLARDSSFYELLAERVRYEGTPGLWHILLWLAIRAGLPFDGFYLISVACALIGATLILWRAPFPAPLRMLLLASYFFSYQFSIVARSYALDLALVPALACVFPQRTKRPVAYGLLIGLLANSNAHSLCFASVLGVEWLWVLIRVHRTKAASWGLALAIGLGLFAMLVAWQPSDNAFVNPGIKARSALAAGLLYIDEAFIDRPTFWSAIEPTPLDMAYGAFGSIVLLLPSLLLFLRAGTLLLGMATMVALTGFSVMVYAMQWHSGILFLAWIFGLWITWPAMQTWPALGRMVVTSFAIITAVQATEGVHSGLWDIKHAYTGSVQAAQKIASILSERPRARIAAAGFQAIEVQPYFPHNIFANFHGGNPSPSFLTWKTSDWRIFSTLPEAYAIAAAQYDIILMSTFNIHRGDLTRFDGFAAKHGYRILKICPGNRIWKGYNAKNDAESFIIYGVENDQPKVGNSP
ncbi:MAG: hypothetical protein EPN31_07810 [Castellaniella sp.]|uniref:hypothetical protein n=1 Tax=Castellaniella sp. TaxID=1955812 RepID=UPI00121594D3|nr:hypothetical protein [Castellaniella sp.]TAN28683.1 MAG: hypothetical protein EPN31_07810 [Castellaniella sp.]